jgi:two-component system, LytTR family, sensor kinase
VQGYTHVTIFDQIEKQGEYTGEPAVRRMIAFATFFLWSTHFLIVTARSVAENSADWQELLLPRAILVLIGMGFCYALHHLLQWAGIKGQRWQWAAAVILAPIAADAFGWCNVAIAAIFFGAAPPSPLGDTILQLSLNLWFFSTWIGLYLALSYSSRLRRQERREAETRILAQAAQLQALHYQINPHFLFNTLNSISSLVVDGSNAKAEEMLQRLSDFLRMTLQLDPSLDVAFEQEIALQRVYLEVEKVRYPDLDLSIRVADEVGNAQVPSLILQPLVENAIKHGVATNMGVSNIDILATRSGQRINLEVTNQVSEATGSMSTGIGLQNVRDRLQARFGDLAELSTEYLPTHQFKVKLSMPLVMGG